MKRRRVNFNDTQNYLENPSEQAKKPFPLFFILLIIIILFIGGCITKTIFGKDASNNPEDYLSESLEPKKPEGILKRFSHFVFAKEVKLEGEKDDRVNILLLGMGGLGHDGPYLTDTIIIASIKPSTNQIALISIPRDLGVEIPGYGYQKINHANAYGENDKPGWGGAIATEVIEKTFDINIQYYARIDFKAFKEIIDEVGGVTVNIERSFSDTEFPAANDEYKSVSFKKGIQEMNGTNALNFARSRHGNNGEGSDFARSVRQQKILLALKEKLLSAGTLLNPIKINAVIKSLDKHLTTNMEFSDIIALAKLAKELDTNNITRLTVDSSENGFLKNGYTAGGAFILSPVTGNFDSIKKEIKDIFVEKIELDEGEIQITQKIIQKEIIKDDTPQQAPPAPYEPTIEILNGTWQAGLAARTKNTLIEKRLNITNIGNTTERPIEKGGIYVISEKITNDVPNIIKETLNIPIKKTPPSNYTLRSDTDILIILGEDFQKDNN